MKLSINIFWFRRDLRLHDNIGLYHALNEKKPVLPIFIFDTNILEGLPKDDSRVTFIYNSIKHLNTKLKNQFNSSIALYFGKPIEVYKTLIKNYTIKAVYTNHDYEPYAIARDTEINNYLSKQKIVFKTFKDHVIFEKNDILKRDGTPYLVYTPYMKSWKALYKDQAIHSYESEKLLYNLVHNKPSGLDLKTIGFEQSSQEIKPFQISSELIQKYEATRNFPAKESTTYLGPHLRFGTVSIRRMVKKAISETNQVFLQELIWREFFIQILWHFPHTINTSFKPQYDRIQWRNNENEFRLWCQGKTGYPLVDAGMRQLNKTGFMHNRVRMVVGSFLCKHLLIDWRWGEAYFAKKLHDYDLASNVGNWQWVAGCGVDAAPYFRIFNPTTQIEKFDKQLEYIKKWVPELQELTYPTPIIDHKEARERCLNTYKKALN